MKKILVSVTCLIALSLTAIPVGAQTRGRSTNNDNYERRYDHRNSNVYDNQVYQEQINRRRAANVYDNRYGTGSYYDGYYDNGYYDNRSVWDQSRDKITTAAGAGAGALIGGLIGGTKGAIIGALAGGGGAALYTYKLRDKDPY